jgi:hypothetical protein
LTGQVLIAAQLGTIGILGCLPQSANISYGIGALMMLINLTFATTLGPVCYTIVAELPAAEVRAQTVVLARAAYVISGIVNAQITPRMLSTGDWYVLSFYFRSIADLAKELGSQMWILLPRNQRHLLDILLLQTSRIIRKSKCSPRFQDTLS